MSFIVSQRGASALSYHLHFALLFLWSVVWGLKSSRLTFMAQIMQTLLVAIRLNQFDENWINFTLADLEAYGS